MNTKSVLSFAAIATALALLASPLALNSVLAYHYEDNDSIEQDVDQSISQNQNIDQDNSAITVGVGGLVTSTNTQVNFADADQTNNGDNIAVLDAQNGDD